MPTTEQRNHEAPSAAGEQSATSNGPLSTRRELLLAALGLAVVASCGQESVEVKPYQGPLPTPAELQSQVGALQRALEKNGHEVVALTPPTAQQLLIVVRHVHAPSGGDFPDPNGTGRALLASLASSATDALQIALRTSKQREVFADGLTREGSTSFDSYLGLTAKQRSLPRIDAELQEFAKVRAAVQAEFASDPIRRAAAEKMLDASIRDWQALREGVAEFQSHAATSPLHAVVISDGIMPLISEDPDLHRRTLQETLAGASSNTPNTDGNLETLIREAVKAALCEPADPVSLFGSENLAKLQGLREDLILRRAAEERAVSVVLMGAGHRFADNIAALGLDGRVALVEIVPKAVRDLARS